MNRIFLASLLVLGLTACDGSYPALSRDSGVRDGSLDGDTSECPSTATVTIAETTRDVRVTPSASGLASLCDPGGPTGARAYLALDARAGEHWHVHASASATAELRLAVLAASCDPGACLELSSFCSGGGDEHLDFVADASGRYWIVLEDEASTGTELRVDAIRTVCGDGTAEHGEACDDGNTVSGDGCDRRCRRELLDFEVEPNDTPIAANVLRPVGGSATISGNLAGPGACTYPDVFAVAQTGTLRVRVQPTNRECVETSSEPLRVVVRSAAGNVLRAEQLDLTSCTPLELTELTPGEVQIELSSAERFLTLEYDLTVEVP